ncbi:MAG: hypothetical protein KJ967_00785 [Elusimicrobia bacterium]|nr:hypothetical protein [Elusimicrobiota bacterium]
MPKTVPLFLFLISIFFFCSCAPIPKWVEGPLSYQKDDYIYVVGYSAPTMYQHDAEKYAKDNALYELAKVMKVEVKQSVLDIMTKERKEASAYDSFIKEARKKCLRKSLFL